jgi:DNA-binding NarL/FixJ family response regulator
LIRDRGMVILGEMAAENPIKLLLIDDHSVVRMGLASVLEAGAEDFQVVAQSDSGEHAADLIREHRPDVTLLDIRMPRVSGLEALKAIREGFPEARVIMLSTSNLEEDFVQALDAGASGYLVKTTQPEELIKAIRTVHAGQRYLPESIAARLAARPQRRTFTPRELDVLDLLRRGMSNRDIGLALGVSENTAKTHVKGLFLKLEAADRAEAVGRAYDRGLLRVEDDT